MALQPRTPLKDLLSVSFNQDAGCFACGTSSGFRVFTTEPFAESCRRTFDNGGICLVEMLFRTSIFALVGGGPIPRYPPNKVILWDDHQGRAIGELVCKTPVRAVRLRKDRVAVASEQKVFLYDLEDLRQVLQVETAPNPDGLLTLSVSADCAVLACPGLNLGKVRVDLLDTRRTKIIDAHKNHAIAALALSPSGKLLATASERGTVIRVFSTGDGSMLKEVRRGSDPAKIYSLALNRGETAEWLALTSDKGTMHVFDLRGGNGGSSSSGGGGGGVLSGEGGQGSGSGGGGSDVMMTGTSPGSSGSGPGRLAQLTTRYAPYFSSEKSWAQYRLPDNHRCTVAFGKDPTTLLIASTTGAFHRVTFDPDKKGPCEAASYSLFMEEEEFED